MANKILNIGIMSRQDYIKRTIKTLERYGVVELHKQAGKLAPTVKTTDFRVQFGLHHGNAA